MLQDLYFSLSQFWNCPGRLLSAFVAAIDGSKAFQAALVLLQAGRQQMENKLVQELWDGGGAAGNGERHG